MKCRICYEKTSFWEWFFQKGICDMCIKEMELQQLIRHRRETKAMESYYKKELSKLQKVKRIEQ